MVLLLTRNGVGLLVGGVERLGMEIVRGNFTVS